jgi:hypothetical protein
LLPAWSVSRIFSGTKGNNNQKKKRGLENEHLPIIKADALCMNEHRTFFLDIRLEEPDFELTKPSTGKVHNADEQLTSNSENSKQQIHKNSS